MCSDTIVGVFYLCRHVAHQIGKFVRNFRFRDLGGPRRRQALLREILRLRTELSARHSTTMDEFSAQGANIRF
jgi:hypothetical protein